MERLAPGDLHLARPVFAAMDHHLAVVASLAGETPAEVFVDRRLDPRSAALIPWNRHRIYVAGASADPAFAEALVAWLRGRYTPSTPETPPFGAIIYHEPIHRCPALAELLADIPAQAAARQYLRLQAAPQGFPAPTGRSLPTGCVVRPIDRDVCADETLTNRDDLLDEIVSESHSIEDFLRNKLGQCVQCGDELAGWCLSEYNHGQRCELGVETLPRFRRQGVALTAVAATIGEAFHRGITEIGWHCWSANAPSVALAKHLGFEHVLDYAIVFCQFGHVSSPPHA
jgi:hypothetical protein